MVKLKTGEQVSWKEAMIRFKKGVEDITPSQKLKYDMRGTLITLIGFILSLIVVIIKRNDIGILSYGLILIFIGSSISTFVKYLGMRQQMSFFKTLDVASILEETRDENYKDYDINQKEEVICLKE